MNWEERASLYYQQLNGRPRPYRPYRCAQCYARKAMPRELWQYKRCPKCTHCGAKDWWIDNRRFMEWQQRLDRFASCRCDGAWFPHRPGSLPLCIHAVEGQISSNLFLSGETSG